MNKQSGQPYDVYIGRGSKWGNPYAHVPSVHQVIQVKDREEAIERFEEYVASKGEAGRRQIQKELKGKVLGCFCAPLACHGDVLARIANEEE